MSGLLFNLYCLYRNHLYKPSGADLPGGSQAALYGRVYSRFARNRFDYAHGSTNSL